VARGETRRGREGGRGRGYGNRKKVNQWSIKFQAKEIIKKDLAGHLQVETARKKSGKKKEPKR
jgi:hypothetical protein